MVNRAELVEKAAVVIANYLDPVREKKRNGEYDEFDYGQAAAVVDALLSQVTTVEELETLPERSAVVYEAGPISLLLRVDRGSLRGDSWLGTFEQAINELGTLTVVWSPS